MIKRVLLCLLACTALIAPSFGQALMDYERYYSQNQFSVSKVEDLVYGKAITNYYLYSGSGSKTEKSNYNLVTQIPLTLDLYNPDTSSKPGKRAVLLLIPGGGRTGCLGTSSCDQETQKQSGLWSNTAYYISQEGTNYNEISVNPPHYAKTGFVVLSLNHRYTYHDKRYESGQTHRWFKSNGTTLLNAGSSHLENLVVDIKRAIRWISHPSRASAYNIDPNNIFIQGGSGGAKMASLAAATATDTLLADSPSHTQTGNSQYQFEVDNNNLLVPQKALRGTILFAGDMQGTRHRELITADTGAFMLWHGTKDRSILHGIAETIEQKCEEVGCVTEFYSLANVKHGDQGSAQFEHTDRVTNPGGLKAGIRAHLHDFIVNHLDKGTDNRPQLSINSSKVKFNESSGRADIEINLSRAVAQPVSFTASADQMREVMNGDGKLGAYSYIEDFVANDSVTTGPIAYDQGSGVAYEDINNVSPKYAGQTYHDSGPGNGNPVVIPASSNYHSNDFNGKKQVITIPAGQTKATFRVTLLNDTKYEKNECFKVRLLNANGARITNSVESITILDDDNPNAGTATPDVCKNPSSNNGGGGTPTGETVKPVIQISAPTKTNNGPITDTTIIVEDNEAISVGDVVLRSYNSAGVSNFNCNQTNSKRVDCTITITSSGDLQLTATDVAGNVHNKNENGYTINSTGQDTQRPSISFYSPTKISSNPITDTTVLVQDNEAISAGDVNVLSNSTADISNFNCNQRHAKRVDCTMRINSSGDVKISATDEAGNLANNSKNGYLITGVNNLWITVSAPTKTSSGPITDTTFTVHNDEPILPSGVGLRWGNTAGVSNLSCSQTSVMRLDCSVTITSSGDLKLMAVDQAGNVTHKNVNGYVIN